MMKKENRYGKQQGAALIVALIMLLVMTVLGASTMGTATMEMRMAANDRFSENAFQLAETGLETVLAGINADTINPPDAAAEDPNCLAGDELAEVDEPLLGGTHQSTVCFLECRPDFDSWSTFGEIGGYNFRNNTQGIAQGHASSMHRLGMRILGPKCDY